MITISIDEKACVGCEMCVDECPTNVYEFDAERAVPRVAEPTECFGCLACAQICPSDAIDHHGIVRSVHHYHDPYAVDLASKLTGEPADIEHTRPGSACYAAGLDDLGVRLQALASVLKSTLNSGLPGVGIFAGRVLARQLPRYRSPRDLEDALQLTAEQFHPAWELAPVLDGDTLTLRVDACFVREVCQKSNVELGGDLCALFYNCLAGYVNSMGKVRLRLAAAERGPERCTYRATIHP